MTAPDRPDDEGFLGRWSRRKAEARQPDEPAVEDASPTEAEPATIDPADLPDIDSLHADSDFSVFMRDGVPASLRTLALRKLWRLNPTLANLDGLVDYGEDLTGSFQVVAKLKSAYQVGKGFLRDEEAVAEEPQSAEAEDEIEAEPATAASAADEPLEALEEAREEASDEVDETPRRRPLPRRG